MKVFISYSHRQGQWVWTRLVPVLRAAGCSEVLADKERFVAGLDVFGQMDALQDRADTTLIVLSSDYLASAACRHELDRAIASDADFSRGKVLPVKIAACDMAVLTSRPKVPLWVSLVDDRDTAAWELLLKTLGASALGTRAPQWLAVRDEVVRKFRDQQQSVNVVVRGRPNWRALLEHMRSDCLPALAVVNLDDPATATLEGLVRAILASSGLRVDVPRGAGCIAALNALKSAPERRCVALTHFDNVIEPKRRKAYGVELFFTLRHLISDERKLVALFESRTPFRELLPKEHPLSGLHPEMIELHGDGA